MDGLFFVYVWWKFCFNISFQKCLKITAPLCYVAPYGLKPIRNISTAASTQVETIGDAYMVVSGAPEKEGNHAERVCDMALDMVDAITDLKDPSTGE